MLPRDTGGSGYKEAWVAERCGIGISLFLVFLFVLWAYLYCDGCFF
jgi:hypothetical protein